VKDVVTVLRINRLDGDDAIDGDTYAGIDEVGVQSLAGPMLAAVVVLRPHHGVAGLPVDSKRLASGVIQSMAADITPAVRFAWIGSLDAAAVDRIGVHEARFVLWKAAAAAVREVLPVVAIVIDGGDAIPGVENQTAIPAADDTHDAVSAAAILATDHCHRVMTALDVAHPGYGLAQHKGYATRDHVVALQRLGLSPAHRPQMTQSALLKGVPIEERDVPDEQLQTMLQDLAPLLKDHEDMVSEWTLNFVREQWRCVMVQGRRPTHRQQFFLVMAYKEITKAARKKGFVTPELAESHRLTLQKTRPVNLTATPAPAPKMGQPARNRPCPCGSGLNYKRCCAEGAKTASATAAASVPPPSQR
jgi:ribonuclease HII